jgi:hypothetical protein
MPPKPVVVSTPELTLDLADRCEEVAADVAEKAHALSHP